MGTYGFIKSRANSYRPLAASFGGSAAIAAKGVSLVFLSRYHSSNNTPSVSRCSTAPPLGSQENCTNSPWCIPIGILRTAGNPSATLRAALLPFQGRFERAGNEKSCGDSLRIAAAGFLRGGQTSPNDRGRGWLHLSRSPGSCITVRRAGLLGKDPMAGDMPPARRLRTDSGGTAPDSHRVPYSPPGIGRHLNALFSAMIPPLNPFVKRLLPALAAGTGMSGMLNGRHPSVGADTSRPQRRGSELLVEWKPPKSSAFVGGGNLPLRSVTRQSGMLNGSSQRLPPKASLGGSWQSWRLFGTDKTD